MRAFTQVSSQSIHRLPMCLSVTQQGVFATFFAWRLDAWRLDTWRLDAWRFDRFTLRRLCLRLCLASLHFSEHI
jgi:hypothetical protein